MINVLKLLMIVFHGLTKSRSRLAAENLALRQQLIVLNRKVEARPLLRARDRWVFALLYRFWPSLLTSVLIVKPETVLRWHLSWARRNHVQFESLTVPFEDGNGAISMVATVFDIRRLPDY